MILAAVSGGLDSVAMLYKLLSEGGETIHVHHISLRNFSRRWQAEDRAMTLIVPWLRQRVRDFGYSESTRINSIRADIVTVSEECAAFIRGGIIARPHALARGANAHDMENGGTGRRQKAALAKWIDLLGPDAPTIIFPIANMRRRELWDSLPAELRALTTSCRKPRAIGDRFMHCGSCMACKQLTAQGVPLDRELACV